MLWQRVAEPPGAAVQQDMKCGWFVVPSPRAAAGDAGRGVLRVGADGGQGERGGTAGSAVIFLICLRRLLCSSVPAS